MPAGSLRPANPDAGTAADTTTSKLATTEIAKL